MLTARLLKNISGQKTVFKKPFLEQLPRTYLLKEKITAIVLLPARVYANPHINIDASHFSH